MLELEERITVNQFVQEPDDVPAWVQTFQDSYLQMTDALIKSDRNFAICKNRISGIVEIYGLKGDNDQSIYHTNASVFCEAMITKLGQELTALNKGVQVELACAIPTEILPRQQDFKDPMSLNLIKFYNHMVSQFAGRGEDISKQRLAKIIAEQLGHSGWIGSSGMNSEEKFENFIEKSFTKKKGEVHGYVCCYVADSWKVVPNKIDWKNGCRDGGSLLVKTIQDTLTLLGAVHKDHKPMAEIMRKAIQSCDGTDTSVAYGTIIDFPGVSFVFRKTKLEVQFETKTFDLIADFLKKNHPQFTKV
jgi:hypothetical protein